MENSTAPQPEARPEAPKTTGYTVPSYAQPAYTMPPPGSVPPYAAAPYSYRPPERPQIPSDRRDLILAAVLLVASVLSADLSLFGGFRIGFSISYLLIFCCGAVYLRHTGSYGRPYGIFCAVAALAGAGVYVLHDDPLINFFTFFGVLFLTMLALVESTGVGKHDSGEITAVADAAHMFLIRPLIHVGTSIGAIFRVQRDDRIEKRRFGGALIGLLCALPVLAILVGLLVSADAAFEGLLKLTVLDRLAEVFVSLAIGLVLFCVLYSRLFSLRHELKEDAVPSRPANAARGLDALPVNTFLGAICAVYVVYLFSQLAYFFSAFSGILPEEFSVAEYARRGFGEMCAVCAINLVLIACASVFSKHKDGKAPLSTRLFCLFILLFSLGLVAVSVSKMALYIHSFGMTRLRILTNVFMLMLACVLIFIGIRLFAVRFPYMRASVIAVALIGLAAAYIDVDTTVARYNVTAYQNGTLEEIDIETLGDLSEGAIPYLITLREELPLEDDLTRVLFYKLTEFADVDLDEKTVTAPAYDWREFNLDRRNARRLLLDNADSIVRNYTGLPVYPDRIYDYDY